MMLTDIHKTGWFINKLGNGSVKVRDLGLLFPFSLTQPGRVEDEINTIFTNPHTKNPKSVH